VLLSVVEQARQPTVGHVIARYLWAGAVLIAVWAARDVDICRRRPSLAR
jgi:hypothetical protein